MVMELVAPITFIATFLKAPLSPLGTKPAFKDTTTFLAALFLTHYANRAVISPLRTPSRSRAHVLVTSVGIAFNTVNGFLMGAFLSSPEARYLTLTAFSRWTFWLGIAMWSFGFVGNVLHDEVLLNIRRDRKRKAKQAEGKDKDKDGKDNGGKEHYAVPYGYLFRYISFPNYFCEWIEWAGFALAASDGDFTTPPWLFLYGELFTMAPRAWRGHQWYQRKFPDYPKERKVVIPFIF
jgi:3-oxo-5-alpha-steroid 4-dehydrogenase 1